MKPVRDRYESERDYQWIIYAVGVAIVGVLAGLLITSTGAGPAVSNAPAAATSAAPPAAVVDEAELRAYRDILARDPKNLQAAVKAGNILYDAQRYAEAVTFYQQAFALNPSDVNVSTDLGTALWYLGKADEALAQYDRSLAIDPAHQQTLFNMGVVRADGKGDFVGAAAAWRKLLSVNPNYPSAARVRTMLAEAEAKAGQTR